MNVNPDAICENCGKKFKDHFDAWKGCSKRTTVMSEVQTIKRKVLVEKEIDIAWVSIRVPYDDDDEIPEGTHGADDGVLDLMIEIATGQIVNWPADGKAINIYLKPRDSGTYKLIAADGILIAEIDENYVPNGIVPGDYGDYVDLRVNAVGKVVNWKRPGQLEFDDGWKCVNGMRFPECED